MAVSIFFLNVAYILIFLRVFDLTIEVGSLSV